MTKVYGDKTYLIGRIKSTNNLVIWEKKRNSWKIIHECADMESIKKTLTRLKENAYKRDCRKMIADLCGTTYKAAMQDMGLSVF